MFDPAMVSWLAEFWGWTGGLLLVGGMCVAAGHAILTKRDTRAAVGWVGLIWFAPGLGIVLYFLFGINRIRRRARHVLEERVRISKPAPEHVVSTGPDRPPVLVNHPGLGKLSNLTGKLSDLPLLDGNHIEPLVNGDEAFPRMLDAIDSARRSLTLSTYIFDNDPAGERFRGAVRRAHERGVEVRVLVDDVGARYSFPSMTGRLKSDGIPVQRFMQTRIPWRFRYYNLRNHRKILVVDGQLGFTGGLNIRHGHLLEENPDHPIQDLHFQLEGPVVSHLQLAFAEDWAFVSGERLMGERWFPEHEARGSVLARGISDGPDEDYDKLRWTMLGALSCAEQSVQILTPYFLPDSELTSALGVASLRGVDVDIILPAVSNLKMVQWASTAYLEEVLERGCRVHFSPPPFDHSKLMLVDGAWTLLGSTNWDPRSLKLNFEFNVECYDPILTRSLRKKVNTKIEQAHPVTLEDVRARSLPRKLRDGVFRLFSPYL